MTYVPNPLKLATGSLHGCSPSAVKTVSNAVLKLLAFTSFDMGLSDGHNGRTVLTTAKLHKLLGDYGPALNATVQGNLRKVYVAGCDIGAMQRNETLLRDAGGSAP